MLEFNEMGAKIVRVGFRTKTTVLVCITSLSGVFGLVQLLGSSKFWNFSQIIFTFVSALVDTLRFSHTHHDFNFQRICI